MGTRIIDNISSEMNKAVIDPESRKSRKAAAKAEKRAARDEEDRARLEKR